MNQPDRPFEDEPTEVLQAALDLANAHAIQAARFRPQQPGDALPTVASLFQAELQHREGQTLPAPQGPEYRRCRVCTHIEPEHEPNAGPCLVCDCAGYQLVEPSAWVDGDPLMEAIAAAVWEHCQRSDSGLVVDDPRNIAAAASAVVSPQADRAQLRNRIAAALIARIKLAPVDPSPWGGPPLLAATEFDLADAVLAVLPEQAENAALWDELHRRDTETDQPHSEPTARAAGLLEAAEVAENFDIDASPQAVAAELRRLAVEAHDTGTQQQETQRAYPDCERCGDTGVDPEWDGAERCPECQQTNEPAPVAQQPAAEAPTPWVVQKICCGRDDGTAEFATWEAADGFRETYIDSSRVAGHERSAIIRRKDAPATEQQAAAADGEETCGKTRSVDGATYRPCARRAGHPEAYCRSADGNHLFLAPDAPRP